jgi:aminoglycoside phosphotransferase (APT) family kinase protein
MATPPLGTLLARGRTADLYAWEAGQVLKLFHHGCTLQRVEHEAAITRAVCAAGLEVPVVDEVVEVSGRFGLVYTRVDGPSLLATLSRQPWTIGRAARLLATLHTTLHTYTIPALPSQRHSLTTRIQAATSLSPLLKEAVLHMVSTLPDDARLCHGDFHPGNVLMTVPGPVIIDWPDATSGNPMADVARTSLLLRVSEIPPGTPRRWILASGRRWLHQRYLAHYFRQCPGMRAQLIAWQPVIAAARLAEGLPAERERLLAMVKASVSRRPVSTPLA